MHLSKDHIRKTILAKRQAVAEAERMHAAHAVIAPLLQAIAPNARVAGYCAIRGELDITLAMHALFARGNSLCLPVIAHTHAPLVFHAWNIAQPLIKGSYGIEVPKEGREAVPDAVIVPLVAFDDAGFRVGYGAGYYDATIRNLRQSNKSATFIGVGYDFQRIEHVPAEAHDEPLDKVIAIPAYTPGSGSE